jgi:uncharacterized protein involved in exopolysaccharide biosynthesis
VQTGPYKFGQTIPLPFAKMVVINEQLNSNVPLKILVRLTSMDKIINKYYRKLVIEPTSERSSVIKIAIVDPVQELGEDFLDQLVYNYNKDAIDDKNLVARNTDKFINKRLDAITTELDTVEGNMELFKRQNKVTDIMSESQAFLEAATDYQKEYLSVQTKQRIVSEVSEMLSNATNQSTIPSNLVPDEGNVSGLIEQYNLMVMAKKRLLNNATSSNPAVQNMDQQLTGLRQSIKQG